MRVLAFGSDEESKTRFSLIYQGFLFGTPEGGLRGFEVNRRANKIFGKLEDISQPVYAPVKSDPSGVELKVVQFPGGDVLRELKPEGGEIRLEDAEYEMLSGFLNNAPWTNTTSRKVADLADFFEAAAKE
jgi:hypothetical protein